MRTRVRRAYVLLSILWLSAALLTAPAQKEAWGRAHDGPWPVRAVIVTTFEIGADTGDIPGEFQLWAEREHLDEVLAFPLGTHPLRANRDHTVLGMVSGTTLVNAAASMMALGLDPRFDLSRAYFLINGIAGVDPREASMGSVAWARYVVSDVARSIDPRDAPHDPQDAKAWPYGIFPIGATSPNPATVPASSVQRSNLYTLNSALADWAFAQTKDLNFGDDPRIAAFRAEYKGFPNAQRPPFVLEGDTFASDLYWHGPTMTAYAEDWVRLYTEGKGRFVMTEMEDSGFMESLERLGRAGKVDPRRVMVLRGGSNYCTPRPGHTSLESVTAPYLRTPLPLEDLYLAGSTVLHKLVSEWPATRDHIPQPPH